MNKIYCKEDIKENIIKEDKDAILGEETSLVPIIQPEKKSNTYVDSNLKKYRKGKKEHIIYTRIYLLFFFVGACVFASGKWDSITLSDKIFGFLLSGAKNFPDFCFNFAPAVFGSFLVYASGFTVYAPLLSVIYSALTFLFFGIASSGVVFLYGLNLNVLLFIVVLGLICVACIIFCSVTAGISKIASLGIGKLSVIDGLLYSLLYWGYVLFCYLGIKGLCFLLPA